MMDINKLYSKIESKDDRITKVREMPYTFTGMQHWRERRHSHIFISAKIYSTLFDDYLLGYVLYDKGILSGNVEEGMIDNIVKHFLDMLEWKEQNAAPIPAH